MKILFTATTGLLLVQSSFGISPLPFYEPFPAAYTNGTLLGAGSTATVWDIGNSGTSGGPVVTNAATLSFPGLSTSNGSFGLQIAGTPSSTRNKGATFTSQVLTNSNPTVYASLLLNIASTPMTNRLFAALSSSSNGTSPSGVVGVWVDSSSRLLLSKNSSSTPALTNTAALAAGNHLVVLRYKWSALAGGDEVALWVDPGSLGVGESSVPNPAITTTNGADISPLQSFWVFDSTTANVAATLLLDEIRVGTRWAAVTPTNGSVTLPRQPYFTQTLMTSQGVVLRGTNGSANGVYQVLCSTNLALPQIQWPSIATNSFDANGNFDCTNSTVPPVIKRFYRLLLGGQLASPVAPSIVTQPTNLTETAGQSATFTVSASGTGPLSYQWFFNTNTVLSGSTNPVLTISNAQTNNAGGYSVIVTNTVGSATSTVATLTVIATNVAPSITTQPQSQSVAISNNATFTVVASGTAPLAYRWYFNTNTLLAGAAGPSLTVTNAQTNNAGGYSVIVTNTYGSATSLVATLTVTPPTTNSSRYNLTGFAAAANTTGGGILADTDPNYAKVYTATDLAVAINSKTVKVIEIMNDLNLGYNEIPADAKTNSEPFRVVNPPLLHPVLLQVGLSIVDIQKKNGLTIFSANGATIRHANLNVKNCGNVIIRNLKFDEIWEWDEATRGQYDLQDWDFITIGDGGQVTNMWIDHCTFTKSYDGIIDMKSGSAGITVSWCKFTGDDEASNTNSWVWQQINSLESNKTSYAFYNFLRSNGFSVQDIVTIIQGHDKTMLIGANDLDPVNDLHTVTLHHDLFINPWDRLPRLRAGNVHDYNILADDTLALAARRLRDAREAAMSSSSSNTLNNTYSFKPPLNGTISTENGATLVEKSVYIDSLWPLRNNQTDPTNSAYTGKIEALDTIYQFDSTFVRGNSTDPGSPLGPFQATIIPFSWNLPGNQLPYTYTMDDPSQLQAILSDPNTGAGSGVVTWAKTNWLKTSY